MRWRGAGDVAASQGLADGQAIAAKHRQGDAARHLASERCMGRDGDENLNCRLRACVRCMALDGARAAMPIILPTYVLLPLVLGATAVAVQPSRRDDTPLKPTPAHGNTPVMGWST